MGTKIVNGTVSLLDQVHLTDPPAQPGFIQGSKGGAIQPDPFPPEGQKI